MTTKQPSSVDEYQKSQSVRLLDVFVLAPYLIYLAQKKELAKLDKQMLIIIAGATIVYNGRNYIKNVIN